MARNYLSPDELFGHVQDATYFHFPKGWFGSDDHGHLWVPQPLATPKVDAAGRIITDHHGATEFEPVWTMHTGSEILDKMVEPLDFVFTKFMVLELVAAGLLIVIFGLLSWKLRKDFSPRGKISNMLEAMLLYIRNDVARPAIGHDADKYVPLLWTLFFFVLACNLLGMIPWLGAPTGALATTGALAFVTFATVVAAGMSQYGFVGFFKAQVPHMDLPKPVAIVLIPMIFFIEMLGLLIKHFVLAVRLLANMMAGHVVLGVIIAFIGVTWGQSLLYAVVPTSIIGAVLLSLLELFVAFLHAYIFTFLTALFIGAAVHAH